MEFRAETTDGKSHQWSDESLETAIGSLLGDYDYDEITSISYLFGTQWMGANSMLAAYRESRKAAAEAEDRFQERYDAMVGELEHTLSARVREAMLAAGEDPGDPYLFHTRRVQVAYGLHARARKDHEGMLSEWDRTKEYRRVLKLVKP